MKYAYNKREGLTNKALSIKPTKGSFMDRFQGKISQMNKDGHLGVVQNTKIPVKVLCAYPQKASQQERVLPAAELDQKKQASQPVHRQSRSRSNYEALISPKSLNSSNYRQLSLSQENRHSFASSFRRNQKNSGESRKETPTHQRRIQAAGASVLRHSSAPRPVERDTPAKRSRSLQPIKDSLDFEHQFQTPQKHGHLPPYGNMSASVQRFNEGQSSFKGSFDSPRSVNVMSSSSYSMRASQPYASYTNKSKMDRSGYAFGSSIASNSTGFYPTSVSTPSYDQNNENISISCKAEEMLRRTEELSKIAKPDKNTTQNLLTIKRRLDMDTDNYKISGQDIRPGYGKLPIKRRQLITT